MFTFEHEGTVVKTGDLEFLRIASNFFKVATKRSKKSTRYPIKQNEWVKEEVFYILDHPLMNAKEIYKAIGDRHTQAAFAVMVWRLRNDHAHKNEKIKAFMQKHKEIRDF